MIAFDPDLNMRLARAIGWTPKSMMLQDNGKLLIVVNGGWEVKQFDYRQPDIAFCIAAHYDCFPMRSDNDDGRWFCYSTKGIYKYKTWYGPTPQEAIALCVVSTVGH